MTTLTELVDSRIADGATIGMTMTVALEDGTEVFVWEEIGPDDKGIFLTILRDDGTVGVSDTENFAGIGPSANADSAIRIVPIPADSFVAVGEGQAGFGIEYDSTDDEGSLVRMDIVIDPVADTLVDVGLTAIDAFSPDPDLVAEEEYDLITGTPFKDTIFGRDGNDEIYGKSGHDLIAGGSGDDLIYGGAGGDTLRGNTGKDSIFGNKGDDIIRGGAQDDYLQGGEGNDFIDGGFGNDKIYGDANNDTLRGFRGEDQLHGGDGHDTLYGGDGADRLHGNKGDDLMYGGKSNDFMRGDSGRDLMYGGTGKDVMYGGWNDDDINGGNDSDTIFGGHGDDTIYGGTGNDYIEGGVDNDVLYGGKGADIFGFKAGDGVDTILDFELSVDLISLLDFGLTFEDLFLSEDESAAVIQAGDVTIRLENTDVGDLDEASFLL